MVFSLSSDVCLDAFLNNPEEAIVGYHPDGTVFLYNAAAASLYGFSREEMLGSPLSRLLPLHELPSLQQLLRDDHRTEPAIEVVSDRLHKSGARIAVRLRRSLFRSEEGQILGVLERSRVASSEPAFSPAEMHLRTIVEQMPLVCWTTDRQLRITSHYGSRIRHSRKALTGQSVHKFLSSPDASEPPIKNHLEALEGASSRLEYRRDNRTFDLSVEPLRDSTGAIVGCVGMALDITERVKSEEEVRYRATHDGLTGLANYREFVDNLEREIRRAERTRSSFALLLLDLDDLKIINDRYGHLVGNRALSRLAQVMKGTSRATDVAARFGGDEFAILLLEADVEHAERVVERIRTCLSALQEDPAISVSIGLSVYPEDGMSTTHLLETADKRLYQNKRLRHQRNADQEKQSSKASSV